MRKILLISILLIIVCPLVAAAGEKIDVLKQALDTVGYSRADLGYQPKGYWSRYPLDIPYRLSSFDDLFAEPLKLYDYSLTMAGAVERYLDPSFADTSSLGLYYLTYSVGVERKLGGFRSYSANLCDPADSIRGLEYAFEHLFLLGGKRPTYRAFGKRIEAHLLRGMGRVAAVVLAIYAVWRIQDIAGRGNLGLALQITPESVLFWGEMGLGVLLPARHALAAVTRHRSAQCRATVDQLERLVRAVRIRRRYSSASTRESLGRRPWRPT